MTITLLTNMKIFYEKDGFYKTILENCSIKSSIFFKKLPIDTLARGCAVFV